MKKKTPTQPIKKTLIWRVLFHNITTGVTTFVDFSHRVEAEESINEWHYSDSESWSSPPISIEITTCAVLRLK